MQNDVIFEVHLLREVCRAEVAFKLFLAGVLLHVPCHVLGRDALAADGTLRTHLRLWNGQQLGVCHRRELWSR